MLSKSVDGKQDYEKHVVFVAWEDVKFQKTFHYYKLQEASI